MDRPDPGSLEALCLAGSFDEAADVLARLLAGEADRPAEALSPELLALQPREAHSAGQPARQHFPQLQALARSWIGRGQAEAAVWLLEALSRHAPADARLWSDLGVARRARGELNAAAEALHRACELAPDSADAIFNLALLNQELGQLEQALSGLRRAARLARGDASLWLAYGQSALGLGALDEAEPALRQALTLSGTLAALLALAETLRRRERSDEAIALLRARQAQWGTRPDFCHALGRLELTAEHYQAAGELFAIAARLQPEKLSHALNLATCLRQSGQPEAARQTLEAAAQRHPQRAELWYNFGNFWLDLGRFEQAEPAYRRALELRPKLVEAWVNLAHICIEGNRVSQALDFLEQALRLNPGHLHARIHRAHCLLLLGRYREGWPDHEVRHFELLRKGFSYPGPVWQGEPLAGKHLLLLSEGGLGDSLHFVRFIPGFAARYTPAALSFSCPASLHPVLGGFAGLSLYDSDSQPEFDYCLRLLSLPLWLGTDRTQLPQPPYLNAPPRPLPDRLAAALQAPGRKVGLVWQTGKGNDTRAKRSLAVQQLLPLLAAPVSFFSLQPDASAAELDLLGERVHDCGPALTDFGVSAAILRQLDLLISVDTSVAHLAGGLNLPVWLLLPFAPDWRWGLEQYDTPWYPRTRLFRQQARGRWDQPLDRLLQALLAWASGEPGQDLPQTAP